MTAPCRHHQRHTQVARVCLLCFPGVQDVSFAPFQAFRQGQQSASFIPGQGCRLSVPVNLWGPQGEPSVGEEVEATVLGVADVTVCPCCHSVLCSCSTAVGVGLSAMNTCFEARVIDDSCVDIVCTTTTLCFQV